jgi:hypothetical protein
MSSGGLIQLKSIGNATKSMFHSVFKKRINYSMESIEIGYKGTANFGQRIQIELANYGDMVHKCGIQVTLPAVDYTTGCAWVEQIGNILLKEVSIEIGGRCIDKQYGVWMSIWNSLTLPIDKDTSYNNLIGNTSDLIGSSLSLITTINPIPAKSIFVPLNFWFNRNISLALPILSLQSDEQPKIFIEFEKIENLLRGDPSTIENLKLTGVKFYADYIFLSESERKWFTKEPFEMIIDQLQVNEQSKKGGTHSIGLHSFHHPLIELIWVVRNQEYETATDITKTYTRFTDSNEINPVLTGVLRINNVERFKVRNGQYFSKVQPLQHHTRGTYSGVNVYSFAEKPESLYEYTGSFDATVVDNIVLNITLTPEARDKHNRIVVFARNYNTLVFKKGFARIKYVV